MSKFLSVLLGCIILVFAVGCGGGSSSAALPTPTPTPTPSQVFPNDTASAQAAPVKLGTSGGNATDVGPKFCCIGTLGSLWTKTGVTDPVILSNNHVLNKSGNGTVGDSVIQPLQLACLGPTAPAPLTVAHLTQAAPLKPVANETTGPCGQDSTRAALCGHSPSNVDAAIAQIVPGQVDPSGTILDFGAVGANSIAAAPPSSTIGVPTLGEGVGKSGRTTGLTCSTIQSLNVTILVNYDAVCGDTSPSFTAYFNNQVTVSGGSFSAGGDSGSLIVDTATSRPVALLYGGDTTSTVGNPIQDVINNFGGSGAFSIVGGPDHSISCARTATVNSAQVGTAESALVPQERARISPVQQRRASSLVRDLGLASVGIGPSADNPNEGALILHVSGKSSPVVPAMIDGVRTRLVFDDPNAAARVPAISPQQVSQAAAVKETHVSDFMGKPGIQGVGVSISSDNPAETAISIYVIKGQAHPPIPPVVDGIRTKVFEGTPFKAY